MVRARMSDLFCSGVGSNFSMGGEGSSFLNGKRVRLYLHTTACISHLYLKYGGGSRPTPLPMPLLWVSVPHGLFEDAHISMYHYPLPFFLCKAMCEMQGHQILRYDSNFSFTNDIILDWKAQALQKMND